MLIKIILKYDNFTSMRKRKNKGTLREKGRDRVEERREGEKKKYKKRNKRTHKIGQH